MAPPTTVQFGLPTHILRLALEAIRQGYVISVHATDQMVPRDGTTAVEGCHNSHICLVDDADAIVLLGKPFQDFAAVVGATIIDADQLPIPRGSVR